MVEYTTPCELDHVALVRKKAARSILFLVAHCVLGRQLSTNLFKLECINLEWNKWNKMLIFQVSFVSEKLQAVRVGPFTVFPPTLL